MNALRYIPIISAILAFSIADAQKIKTYKAWVTLTNEKQVTGILYSVNEDGIVLLDNDLTDTIAFVDYKTIEILKIRRKGSVGKGAGYGFVGGLLVGAVVGASLDDAENASSGLGPSSGFGGVLIGPPVGALAGLGIGSIKKSYKIKADRKIYLSYLNELKGYTFSKTKVENESNK